jgi:hypothetical protein
LICILQQALLSTLIDGITAIEHLRFEEVAENLYTIQNAEEFLQLVLIKPRRTKPRITSLQFPHVVDITHQSVLTFESRADFVTDTYENDDSFVEQAKGTCYMATYRIAEKPNYGWYKLLPNHQNKLSCWRKFQPRVLPSNKPLILPLGVQLYISNWRPKVHYWTLILLWLVLFTTFGMQRTTQFVWSRTHLHHPNLFDDHPQV